MRNSWICVDANVVVRLVADPTDRPVRQLWERWDEEARSVTAPSLLRYEVTNALYRRWRLGEVSESAARDSLHAALALSIHLRNEPDLHARAFTMAGRFALPAAHDAHYQALAESLGAELWTADERLARAVRPQLSWLRLIGE